MILLLDGHDMIFLDYSICGKNGEPRVVNVSEEDNYEINVIAENFEEFIYTLCTSEENEEHLKENPFLKLPEIPKELHKKVLSSYIKDMKGTYAFIAILLVLSAVLIVFKSWYWTIALDLFIIFGVYFDIEHILKKRYTFTTDKVKKIWIEKGKTMCSFEKIEESGAIIPKKSKNIKPGDEVNVISAGKNIYVIEKN